MIGGNKLKNWSINLDYHFGGYAKINRQLIEFTDIFEPVYTGKMLFGIYDLVRKDYFYVGGKIITAHICGLQGIADMENKMNKLRYIPFTNWFSDFVFYIYLK
ncbi:hypothetical protein BMS3Abin03_03070 [bacterium BMS3Abin03]|nr:hypothetical protein BMS3Abin03_03070 [bacterium BMS3Abin03]